MMNYACDIDVYRLWARLVTGDPLKDFRYSPKYHVCHVARRAGRPYRHGHEEVLGQLGARPAAAPGLPPVYQAAMGTEMYLTRHERLEQMLQDVRFIQALR